MESRDGQEIITDFEEYSCKSILFYEKICGPYFVSPGGREMTSKLVSMIDLKPGQNVLDIGGGIGGSAFYMAKNFNVKVTSVDKSSIMTRIGQERAKEAGSSSGSGQVVFETADITDKGYPPDSIDVVFTLASLFYIEDKDSLLKMIYKILKPGGRLLMSDICCRNGERSPSLQNFVNKWGYHLISLEAYAQMLKVDTNFTNVQGKDISLKMMDILRSELFRLDASKDELIEEFGETLYNQVSNIWREDLDLFVKGDLKMGLFCAEKLS